MRIFTPFKIKETGGTSSFANKFKSESEKRGHEVFFDFIENYDILFVISRCPLKYLWHAKRNKKIIVHRLDGIYYWSLAEWRFPFLNFIPFLIHRFFSDFTIYQSKYSKYCCDKFLGKRCEKNWSIIYNGVDLKKFSPEGRKNEKVRDDLEQRVFFMASRFRHREQIDPILKALEILQKNRKIKNFKVLIAGDYFGTAKKIFEENKSCKYLELLGKIKNDELPFYERSVDLFLYLHPNPACPNNIIEAMACGLPICGADDGSMSELVKNKFNGLLITTTGDAFWKKRKYDSGDLSKNIAELLEKKDFFSRNSRKIAEKKFSLEKMTENYIDIFKNLQNR